MFHSSFFQAARDINLVRNKHLPELVVVVLGVFDVVVVVGLLVVVVVLDVVGLLVVVVACRSK